MNGIRPKLIEYLTEWLVLLAPDAAAPLSPYLSDTPHSPLVWPKLSPFQSYMSAKLPS